MAADWILTGGRIESMDPRASGIAATAMAVAGDRVVAIGDRAEIEALAGAGTRRTELDGATVLPGFCDTHMHLEKIAEELAMVQLAGVATLAGVLDAVAAHAGATPVGEWVRCFGDDGAWHEHQLAERRLPTRAELDRAAGDRAVFLYRGPDAAALSSAAAAALALELAAEDAVWDADAGLLRGAAARRLNAALPSPAPSVACRDWPRPRAGCSPAASPASSTRACRPASTPPGSCTDARSSAASCPSGCG